MIFIVFFSILVLIVAFTALMRKYNGTATVCDPNQNQGPSCVDEQIGLYGFSIYRTFHRVENDLDVLDSSAKYSLSEALFNLTEKGGFAITGNATVDNAQANKPCSFYSYPVWISLQKNCYPDYQNHLMFYFTKRMKTKLEYFADSDLDIEYDYVIKQDGNKPSVPLFLQGNPKEELDFAVSPYDVALPTMDPNYPANADVDIIKKRIEKYERHIQTYSKKYNVPGSIIRAVIAKESSGVADKQGSTGDYGLMQIVPVYATGKYKGKHLHHNECVKECGFKKAKNGAQVDTTEYYEPEKNICCGTYILAESYDKCKGEPPKQYIKKTDCCGGCDDRQLPAGIDNCNASTSDPSCCQGCIRVTYYSGWGCALRRYNGWGPCGDDDYVERALAWNGKFGGNPYIDISNIGVYSLLAPFVATQDFDLSVFEDAIDFSKGLNPLHENLPPPGQPCNDAETFDDCVQDHITDFNDNNEMQISTECENEPNLYNYVDSIQDCANQPRTSCYCELFNIPDSYPVNFKLDPTYIQISSGGQNIKSTLDIKPFKPLGTPVFTGPGFNINIKKSTFLFKPEQEDKPLILIEDPTQLDKKKLEMESQNQELMKCNLDKTYKDTYRFCARTKPVHSYSYAIKAHQQKEYSYSTNDALIKFAVTLDDQKAPEKIEGLKVIDKSAESNSIILQWEKSAINDLYFYNVYCELGDRTITSHANLIDLTPSLILFPRTTDDDIVTEVRECNGQPIADSNLPDLTQYHFVVTARDIRGNEETQFYDSVGGISCSPSHESDPLYMLACKPPIVMPELNKHKTNVVSGSVAATP